MPRGSASGGGRVYSVSIDTIVQGLRDRLEPLLLELLPSGVKEGHEWCVGSVAGEPGRSMKVHLDGAKRGTWKDFSAGVSGDPLDLVTATVGNGDKRAGIVWARQWLGYDSLDPEELEQRKAEMAKRREAAVQAGRRETEMKREKARRLWFSCGPIGGTMAEEYLAARGIDLAALPRVPSALHFAKALYNKETGREFPAMVAGVFRVGAKAPIAVHRTYLSRRADGLVVKAPVKDAKLTWAPYIGGFIPLSRGASGLPITHPDARDDVCISEGIEDGLSVVLGRPDLRVMAAVSLSNMANIKLPETVGTVWIAAQNDGENTPAARMLERTVREFQRQGRVVRIAWPPTHVKDFNDLIRRDQILPKTGEKQA